MQPHAKEIREGKRFPFGHNWSHFLSVIDSNRISEAENSLTSLLELSSLRGKCFLDMGSGSGLFGLSARRLGADVTSVDYDPDSVACGQELKRRYYEDDKGWTIMEGSVLDPELIRSLGIFDIVYSWGVLHHTGHMWNAIDNLLPTVKQGGLLALAIYNDRGFRSRIWRNIKRFYCSGYIGRALVLSLFIPFYYVLPYAAADIIRLRNPTARYRNYYKRRGMSMHHDWIDWLGGYPFEVASAEQVTEYLTHRGFKQLKLIPTLKAGNNQFLFRKE